MAQSTIQFRRQLKFAHPRKDALQYIREKLTMKEGEPLLCTYKEANGKWHGAIEVICIYPKGTLYNDAVILSHLKKDTDEYKEYFNEENKLKFNYIKVINGEWESI